jgi:hypothetical protein
VGDLLGDLAPPPPPNQPQPLLFVIDTVAAVDSDDGMHRHRQTLWHVWWVPLTCHVIPTT